MNNTVIAVILCGVVIIVGATGASYIGTVHDIEKITDCLHVINHLGIQIEEAEKPPQGQTVKFYLSPNEYFPSDFTNFLRFIDSKQPDVIYYREGSLIWKGLFFYDKGLIWFIDKEIIYLFL